MEAKIFIFVVFQNLSLPDNYGIFYFSTTLYVLLESLRVSVSIRKATFPLGKQKVPQVLRYWLYQRNDSK